MRHNRSTNILSSGLIGLTVLALLLSQSWPARAAGIEISPSESGSVFWSVGPVAPGESGSRVLTVRNNGTNSGELVLWLSDIVDFERAQNNPATGVDRTLKLSTLLLLDIKAGSLKTNVKMPALLADFPDGPLDNQYLKVEELAPGEMTVLTWEWHFPADSGSEVCNDVVRFNINYTLRPLDRLESLSGPVTTAAPASESEHPLVLELLDTSITVGISDQGRITQNINAALADDSFSLSMESGTQILTNNLNDQSGNPDSGQESRIPQKISVRIPEHIPELPAGWVAVSRPYEVTGLVQNTVTGLTMDTPALLVIKYDDSLLPAAMQDLGTFYYNAESGWTELAAPAGFIAEGPAVASEVDHFSLFIVLASQSETLTRPPANIVIQKLVVDPPRILVGQTAAVSVRMFNKGGQPGEYDVVVKMNGRVQKTQLVHLDPGRSSELALLLAPNSNGIYHITVGSAGGDLVVSPGQSADISETDYWWLLYLALGIAILLFSLVRRQPMTGRPASRGSSKDENRKPE
jgi:hypothetical protein